MSRAANKSQNITKPSILSKKGIVTSQNRIASEIGAKILQDGGNAVDAAIAVSFALGVVEPWMSGIGGGGYMIIRRADDQPAQVIDFGMCSSENLRISDYPIVGGKANDLFPWSMVKNNVNVFGAKAIAIPGVVAGMGEAHKTFGSMPWADLIAPAITEAEDGMLVDWYAQLIIASAAKGLAEFPLSKTTFLDSDGFPKSSAWTALGQTRCDLSAIASTLSTIADKGPNTFYSGDLAKRIVADLQAAGGHHTLSDFKNYRAKIVQSSEFKYKGHKIFGTPHMTAGPTLERVFDLLNTWQPSGKSPKPCDMAAYDRAIRQANKERFETMGDSTIELAPSCTTHFNIVDQKGTMVSVTQTLLSIFGSRMMLPDSGILMNNGIMWFDPEQGKPNSIGPKKQCLSNMCPTLIERSDGSRFGLGAAGGRKIMPAVAQLTSYLLDYGMSAEEAIHTLRIDSSLDDVTIADDAFSQENKNILKQAIPNITFAPRTFYPFNFACPSIIGRKLNLNEGATEVMSHWADAVSE